LNKYEIAKELTITAIQNNCFNHDVDNKDSYKHINEQVAENIAAFFNKLVKELNINE
jgi:hypothetical protein